MQFKLQYQSDFYHGILDNQIAFAFMGRQIGKTYTATKAISHDCARSPKTEWMIISLTEDLAKKNINDIYEHFLRLEQKLGRKLIKQKSLFEVLLRNGSRAFGVTSRVETKRGYTCNIYLDEICFAADKENLWSTLSPAALVTGKKIVATSSYPESGSDFFTDLYDNESFSAFKMYPVSIVEAVNQGLRYPNGAPIDVEFLRTTVHDTVWRREYMCERVPLEGLAFNLNELFSYSDVDLPLSRYDSIVAGVDCASTGEGDGQAIVVFGTIGQEVFLIDWEIQLMSKTFLRDLIYRTIQPYLSHRAFICGIEQKSAGIVAREDLQSAGLPVYPLPETWVQMSKDDRILSFAWLLTGNRITVMPRARDKSVYYREYKGNLLFKELRDYQFKNTKNVDDGVDAFMHGLRLTGVR